MSMAHPTHHTPTAPVGHWIDRALAALRDTFTGPAGEPCFTPIDRRWLWHLAGFLYNTATTAGHRQMATDLGQYLHETCEHHYDTYPGGETIPPHRQCVWCCTVETTGGDAR